MSGHSKWSNIKHKKEKTDAQKAKVFTKIGKEITIAVRESGPDPVSNTKLRDLIQKQSLLLSSMHHSMKYLLLDPIQRMHMFQSNKLFE